MTVWDSLEHRKFDLWSLLLIYGSIFVKNLCFSPSTASSQELLFDQEVIIVCVILLTQGHSMDSNQVIY